VQATAAMERNRITVSKAQIKSADSEIHLTDLTTGSFAAPVVTANYDVKGSAAEAVRALHWKLPISGTLNVTGKARYVSPGEFDISGTVRGTNLAYDQVRNIRLTANLAGNQAKMALTGLRLNALGGEASGSVETKGYDVFHIGGKISGFDVRELAALGTPRPVPYDGLISGTVEATGRLRDLSLHGIADAAAQLEIAPAASGPPVHGEVSAHYAGAVAKLEMGHSWIELPNTRVDITGTLGSSLTVGLQTKNPGDLMPVLNGRTPPFTLRDGSVAFAGTVTGALENPSIAGHAAVHNAVYEGRLIDSATADITASMNQAGAANASIVSQGITATGNGSISLADWQPTNASLIDGSVVANNVDLTHALDLAGYKDVQVSGTVSTSAHVTGTLGQPVGSADVTLSKGQIYQQPYDSITSHVQYANADLQTASGTFVSGPKRVTFEASYPHAGQPFPAGTLEISANSNVMALNQIALVRQRQPDIEGNAQFKGSAAVRITLDAKKTARLELAKIDGDGSVTGIGLEGRNLGDAQFSARTQGNTLTATFNSNAAKAVIKGEARVDLTGDDQTTGSITFSNAGLNALAALIVKPADAQNITFDGTAEGRLDFHGPLLTPKQMSATAALPQIEVHPLPDTPLTKTIPGFSLHNVGPVKVAFDNSVIRIDAARFQAPETDMTVSGTADISSASPLDLRLQGDVNLAMVRNFVPDLASSGTIAVSGTLRGSWNTPDLSGHASVRAAEFHYADFSNGLTNATGEIVFSGTRATIQSFSADTGGGKFTGSGFATLIGGDLAFQFSARTKDVRLRYPQGISSTSDSELQIVQNPQRSSISGTITIRRLVFNPQTDAAGTLADISYTVPTPAASESSLANMNLDVLIQTAPDVALQSKVAESIQADASLRLRGTVASPALLGRVNISQGSVLFFGNKYTISRGSISFFNPTKIDPILDVDLQTKARGVDVTLTVTGSPSHLGMTYRSDPPLEFSDIVALLATGRTPDDPAAALRGNAPTPSFEQLGASALIGETLATPVAGRLQRFFGVSRIKIDPQLVGLNGNPGARLTVEQQITPDILFTYVTDVSNSSQQMIRAQWDFNPKWSAILAREENGFVGVDFEYKKRFK
jgi:translocation and assembly module TamB